MCEVCECEACECEEGEYEACECEARVIIIPSLSTDGPPGAGNRCNEMVGRGG